MKKLIGWVVVILSMAALHTMFPEFFRHAYGIIEHGDISALADYLRSFGLAGVLVTILLFVIMTFTIVFPFMILSGAAGIVYGLWSGILISWTGEVVGAVVMFVFARFFFREMVEGLISKSIYLKKVDDYSAENGFKALLIARLLPLAPSGIITAVAAISKMSFKDFILATLIGKFPPVVIKVLIGHDLAFANENMTRLILVCLLVVVVYAALWWQKKNRVEA